jgi:BirA family biotin operon repressor/biotin-[acetyl-CoA-carboxylase] ligase
VLTEAVVDEVPVAGKPVDEVFPGTDPADAELSYAVLGIGVNANLDPSALDVDRRVTTLREQVGDVDETAVAATLHERLLEWVARVESSAGFESAIDAWRERAATLGERVRVETRAGETVTGEAVAVTERGALVVESDGSRVEVTEGECARLRRS